MSNEIKKDREDKKIIIYFFCSLIAAGIEAVFLLIFKKLLGEYGEGNYIIIPNTIAIILSSVIHYIMTSKLVFKVKFNFWSGLVYVVTFFVGYGIQNGVLWLTYNKLLTPATFEKITFVVNICDKMALNHSDIRTLICKACSLAASFFVTYIIRNILNSRLKEKMEGN